MTLPNAAHKSHDWAFVAASQDGPAPGGGVAVLIAVCRKCGVMRTEAAPPRREVRVDLSGECPG